MSVQTYDPKEIIVSVAGQILSGFSEDVVTVARLEDAVIDDVGADGEVIRILSNDRRGTITISLLPTSASNLVLSVLANADELGGGNVFPVLVQDNRGNDIHIGAQAWIVKQPDAIYNTTNQPREWELRVADLRMVVGGHSSAVA